MDESSLAKVVNKIIAFLSSVVSIGSAPISTYQENGKINIEERLSIGRRTIYALLGPGLHARSGMSPVVLLKIWNTYAVPSYIYGLEIQAYTPLDTKKLEQVFVELLILFFSKCIKD
jgi:hypothetical protein